MAVREPDIQKREENKLCGHLEDSDWAPEPREGDYVHVWEAEGWWVRGAREEGQLGQLPWNTFLPSKQAGNKGLGQVT